MKSPNLQSQIVKAGKGHTLMLHTSRRRSFYFVVLAVIVTSGIACGDGKFFNVEKVPVGVPYQRAVLMFEDGKETLILQSKYKTVEVEDANSLAWVVPVPSVPELASMHARMARRIFWRLSRRSAPKVIPTVKILVFVSTVVLCSFLIAKVLNWFLAKLVKRGAKASTVRTWRVGIYVVLVMLIVLVLMPRLARVRGGGGGVDVLKAETVGIYDVKVIRGDDASAVTEWLKDNGFGFEKRDSEAFDQYVKKGWCFVTAKIGEKVDSRSRGAISEGLAAPLILRFDSKEAVYPMALTGTTGENTEVLLYVLSDHKMECGERLKLAFFGKMWSPFDPRYFSKVEFIEFLHDAAERSWQMCKFKGTLKPYQMQEDIVFRQAKDDEPYRAIKWY